MEKDMVSSAYVLDSQLNIIFIFMYLKFKSRVYITFIYNGIIYRKFMTK